MDEPANDGEKRVPLHKRFGSLLWRERRTCFWSAIAGTLLFIVAMIWFRQKLLAVAIGLLATLGHGCQAMPDDLKELR
jgi:fatty acid desaturase